MANDDETLLAAYLDGVSELDAGERRRVEELLAADPTLRGEADALRAMIGKLRELPREGKEPDWTAMAHTIRTAVGPAMPRPWWRRWQAIGSLSVLVATAALVVLWLRPSSERPLQVQHEVPVRAPAVAIDKANALWLDGEALDLDDVETSALETLDHEARATEPEWRSDVTGGILPAPDLDWIDNLDDSAIDRAEHWLDRKKT
jgi:hypothetical protein